jgi:hypothetical protein
MATQSENYGRAIERAAGKIKNKTVTPRKLDTIFKLYSSRTNSATLLREDRQS